MPYLVDTDILIDVAKKNQDAVHYLDSLREGWSISVVTAMQLYEGPGQAPKYREIIQTGARRIP